jgi:aspartyl-tRNA(Asn)/glutamyl-tRNA(Gln) amidotransferase subunit A
LRQAGAVITSKLATWEFAIGGSSFDLPWPPARNPWDVTLDPSGSSSGSAVAVAAGLCMGAMGSDTGGSIRGPAAWCGIAGHKPTYGLLSRRGILPLSFSLDHAGPMCWTAEDCALMMQVLACHDPQDAGSASMPEIDFTAGLGKSLSGLRIGVVRHFFESDLLTDPETIAALETSVLALRDMGAVVGDVRISPFGTYADCGSLISRSEAYAIHQHWLRTTPELYGAFGRHRLMAGAFILAADYINAQRERTRLVAELAETMKTVDLLIFPTARCPARPIGEDSMASGFQPFFNRAFNVTGSPALSICNGFSQTGLPLALQIGGRPFEDALVLRVGHALEHTLGTRSRRPALS